ncbi:hypothetical protein LPW11_10745 [Geomonas sp. RF6]|uniref:hypothetical protein n=1 Tax=Geomonas sp. RF6 TaxID=2897342 RepID=UPI001E5C149C|nr:hypothetical protein [Geomonas sp. RF6]UFS72651.1 hypothetical protein LPW11_10745 [Geomonas sp. RF6]
MVITRNLHAKLLLLRRGKQAVAYLGSANFSGKAWLGDNRELGVAWIEERPDFLRDQIFSHRVWTGGTATRRCLPRHLSRALWRMTKATVRTRSSPISWSRCCWYRATT